MGPPVIVLEKTVGVESSEAVLVITTISVLCAEDDFDGEELVVGLAVVDGFEVVDGLVEVGGAEDDEEDDDDDVDEEDEEDVLLEEVEDDVVVGVLLDLEEVLGGAVVLGAEVDDWVELGAG